MWTQAVFSLSTYYGHASPSPGLELQREMRLGSGTGETQAPWVLCWQVSEALKPQSEKWAFSPQPRNVKHMESPETRLLLQHRFSAHLENTVVSYKLVIRWGIKQWNKHSCLPREFFPPWVCSDHRDPICAAWDLVNLCLLEEKTHSPHTAECQPRRQPVLMLDASGSRERAKLQMSPSLVSWLWPLRELSGHPSWVLMTLQ